MDRVRIGVIGGSGLYEMEQLTGVEEVWINTPFGAPSDAYLVGTLEGQRVAFLPRHGRGHRISPTLLNSRANVYGFKTLGVEYLISVSACGSLQPQYAPGDIVVPDQLYDRTRLRASSFFGDPDVTTAGIVVHVSVAEPFCPMLSKVLVDAVSEVGHKVHSGGTFVVIEGPRFSTKAESRVFQQAGFAIVGMTAIPEAFLAREAGMSYATLGHVTDYDVWHETMGPVSVDMVLAQLRANVDVARLSIMNAVRSLRDAPPSPQADALRDAIITARDAIQPAIKLRLAELIGKYV